MAATREGIPVRGVVLAREHERLGADPPGRKQVIDLRQVYHLKGQRIRAHVTLCWLALLLIRIAETSAGLT